MKLPWFPILPFPCVSNVSICSAMVHFRGLLVSYSCVNHEPLGYVTTVVDIVIIALYMSLTLLVVVMSERTLFWPGYYPYSDGLHTHIQPRHVLSYLRAL